MSVSFRMSLQLSPAKVLLFFDISKKICSKLHKIGTFLCSKLRKFGTSQFQTAPIRISNTINPTQ